jgi:hypothetical protein
LILPKDRIARSLELIESADRLDSVKPLVEALS